MAYGPYKDLIIAAAQQKGINPIYLAGLIDQESGWDPQAIGDNGKSFGLGQFNVNGALKTYGLTGEQVLAMDPAQQIDLVADFYKKNLIVAKGDPDKALKLYNGGGDPNYTSKVHRRINASGINAPLAERFAPVGINPEFQQSFNAFQAAAKEAGHIITPGSTFRTKAQQAQLWAEAITKYGTPAKARKWVAPPGSSSHEHGLAMDLKYSSPEAQKWAHENASKFNLNFRLPNEPWHLELTNARQKIDTIGSFGGHTIDITRPAGFEQSIEQYHANPLPGFSDKMQQLLTGVPMDDEDNENQIDPNTAALGQLLNAQQSVGQQPDGLMKSIMADPMIYMGLGIMASEGNFSQQLSKGLMLGMKNYQAYQATEQEAQLSQAKLGVALQNAQTQSKLANMRMSKQALEYAAMANLPKDLQPFASMKLAGVPQDLTMAQYLERHGMDPRAAATTAVTGRIPQVGTELKDVAGGVVEVTRDANGNIISQTYKQTPELAESAGQMAFSKEEQKEFGKDQAMTYQSLGNIPKYEQMNQKIDDLAGKVQADDAPMTGPIVGALQAYLDPFLAELDAFNVSEALDRISESKLAPVSNVDLAEVKRILASPIKTKAQILTLLRISKRMYEQRIAGLRDVGSKLESGMQMKDIYLSRLKSPITIPPTGLPGPAKSAYDFGTAAPAKEKKTITIKGRTIEVEE